MNAAGFRGGAGIATTSTATASSTTYVAMNATDGPYALKGEGIAGQPGTIYDGTTTVSNGNGYGSTGGSAARGGPATGGGGGNIGAGDWPQRRRRRRATAALAAPPLPTPAATAALAVG
ncbi:hypothetical protein [Hymenobacter coccineus]|uniref:Uncharacterized protein n=1 Tax=Hymenobacter coccineus TaxID=1908235 RepID=A0A1G1SVR1_9BACT|nr:hypothetical protein [Hymenobacter coccineus]OGX82697.1 hypothetical protein BEN49_13475 [Hymenobacter coccineus]